MEVLKKKVGDLETIMAELAYSQLKTDMRFAAFQDEMKEFKNEMLDFKDEMKEFKNEMLDFKDEMREYKTTANAQIATGNAQIDKHTQMITEIWEDQRKSRKVWNEMAMKLGSIVEDVVAPNIPRIASELFGITDILDFCNRRTMQSRIDKSKNKEFDVLLFSSEYLIVNETKSTVRMKDLHEFIDFLKVEIYEYLPEARDKKIIPILASFSIPENMVKFLSKNGIYAMALSDETMEIINADDVLLV